MAGGDLASHRLVVKLSAKLYLEQLNEVCKTKGHPEPVRLASQALIRLYEMALADQRDAKLLDGLYTATALLRNVSPSDRIYLCNEFSLGFGNQDAPAVFIGEEVAFELDSKSSSFNYIAETCLLTLFWLLDVHDRKDLAAEMSGWLWQELKGERKPSQPTPILFNRYPAAYYQSSHKKSGHSWNGVGKLIRALYIPNQANCPSILIPHSVAGDLCYLLEINYMPSKSHSQSMKLDLPELEQRVGFLRRVLDSLYKAEYLVIHGAANVRSLQKDDNKLLRMLGVEGQPEQIYMIPDKRKRTQYATRDGKRIVFLTQQLSGANAISERTFLEWSMLLRRL